MKLRTGFVKKLIAILSADQDIVGLPVWINSTSGAVLRSEFHSIEKEYLTVKVGEKSLLDFNFEDLKELMIDDEGFNRASNELLEKLTFDGLFEVLMNLKNQYDLNKYGKSFPIINNENCERFGSL